MSASEIDGENSKNYILRTDIARDLEFSASERVYLRGQMHIILDWRMIKAFNYRQRFCTLPNENVFK